MRHILLVLACLLLSAACGLLPETDDRRIVHPGDVAVVVHGAKVNVPVALSRSDVHVLAKAMDSNDEGTVMALVDTGKAILVAAGTHVRVAGESYNERRIEVTEGAHAGKYGWVPFEWLSFRRS